MSDKEIEHLDEILNKLVYSYGFTTANYHQDSNGKLYGFKDIEEGEKYFGKLAMEFEELGIATFYEIESNFKANGNEHIKFKDKGGFKSYFERLKIEESIQSEISVKKSKKEAREEEIQLFQIDEFKYKETIRKQNERLMNLEEKIKTINVIKNYWWLGLLGYFIGETIFQIYKNVFP